MLNNLKTARVRLNLTQGDIAQKMDVSIQTIYKWEQGLSLVTQKHWPKLAATLHLEPDELEAALVQTLLDACMAAGDARQLENARISRLYRPELLMDALSRFHAAVSAAAKPPPATGNVELEQTRLELEKQILERDKTILELRTQIFELKQMLSDLNPAGNHVVFTPNSPSSSHNKSEVKK